MVGLNDNFLEILIIMCHIIFGIPLILMIDLVLDLAFNSVPDLNYKTFPILIYS